MENIRMKSMWTENSIEGKTDKNKKVVPSDSMCTWSNVNLGYGNMTLQL